MIKNNNKIYKRQRAQPNEMQLECQRWSQQLAAAEAAVREVGLECIERYRGIESPPCKQSQYSANYLCHRRCVAEVALLLVSGEQSKAKLYFLHTRVQAPAGSQNLHTPVNIEDVFHIHSNMMTN